VLATRRTAPRSDSRGRRIRAEGRYGDRAQRIPILSLGWVSRKFVRSPPGRA
jgi:hypothetical protein